MSRSEVGYQHTQSAGATVVLKKLLACRRSMATKVLAHLVAKRNRGVEIEIRQTLSFPTAEPVTAWNTRGRARRPSERGSQKAPNMHHSSVLLLYERGNTRPHTIIKARNPSTKIMPWVPAIAGSTVALTHSSILPPDERSRSFTRLSLSTGV
jgi:hypothetical protein